MRPAALDQPAIGMLLPRAPVLPVAAVLVVVADLLLYRQPAGLSLALFAVALVVGIVAVKMPTSGAMRLLAGAALSVTPLAENVSLLSIAVAATGLAIVALSCSGRIAGGVAETGRRVLRFAVVAPFRAVADMVRALRLRSRMRRPWPNPERLLVWIMPGILGLVFIALFGIANPVIQNWLALIDLRLLLSSIEVERLAFWLVAAAGIWAFLRPRLLRRIAPGGAWAGRRPKVTGSRVGSALFGRRALLRALVVFNAIFAVQSALDIAYLWGGVALPEGMSHAEYAHRGAYPLIVTALLAAVFVLAAMRPGSDTQRDPAIRRLVYLWVGQNVLLVLSSIFRLDLYVGVYSLTYWRVAAFLWMGLVGIGLVTVVARIALGRSNEWLASANLLSLSALLYGCCFINFAALIADYNVDHSREMTGQGLAIDQEYLRQLGPQALPAVDRLIDGTAGPAGVPAYPSDVRVFQEQALRQEMGNWRASTFRNLRLMRYLEARRAVSTPQAEAEP